MLKLFGADVSTLDHITLYAVVFEMSLVNLVTGIIPSNECLVKWPPDKTNVWHRGEVLESNIGSNVPYCLVSESCG